MTEDRRRATGMARIAWMACAMGVLAAGCSAPARSAAPSAPVPASPAFQQARSECTQRAVDATRDFQQQDVASKAAIGIYVECMKEKGFTVGREPN